MNRFTEEEKIKIWLEYVSMTSALNNFPIECDNHKYLDDSFTKYPTLGIATKIITNKLHIRSFESFCNEKDDRVDSGLIGRYYRFHKNE